MNIIVGMLCAEIAFLKIRMNRLCSQLVMVWPLRCSRCCDLDIGSNPQAITPQRTGRAPTKHGQP